MRLPYRSVRAAFGGFAALVAALAAVLGAPPAASAHAELVDTEPGPGETVAKPPTAITLTFFSEELFEAGAAYACPAGTIGVTVWILRARRGG